MAHPGLLLLAGKMGKPKEDGEDDPQEAKLDAVRHLIAAIHSKKEEDALHCIEDLMELCREDSAPKDDEKDEDSDSY